MSVGAGGAVPAVAWRQEEIVTPPTPALTSALLTTVPAPPPPRRAPASEVRFSRWRADLDRRLALHDISVKALADDIASRTRWLVRARGAEGFLAPEPAAGVTPDLLCWREDRSPLCLEVELPETLVRRDTVARLRTLSGRLGYETRLVLIARAQEHVRHLAEGRRLLDRVGLRIPVAAIAPDEDTLTGADW